MSNEAQRQFMNVVPATIGKELVITLDATSRVYDLSSVNSAPSNNSYQDGIGGPSQKDAYAYVTLIADVDFYYAFGPSNTGTLDNTAALTAGGTVNGYTANGAHLVPAKTAERVRINWTQHRYLFLQGSGAGKVRIRQSSELSGRAY